MFHRCCYSDTDVPSLLLDRGGDETGGSSGAGVNEMPSAAVKVSGRMHPAVRPRILETRVAGLVRQQ